MKNNPLYIQLRQIALDGNYTIGQLANVTKTQVENILDSGVLPMQFVKNMKRMVKCILQERDDEIERVTIEQKIPTMIRKRFPNLKVDFKRAPNDGRVVRLWLDGKIDEELF